MEYQLEKAIREILQDDTLPEDLKVLWLRSLFEDCVDAVAMDREISATDDLVSTLKDAAAEAYSAYTDLDESAQRLESKKKTLEKLRAEAFTLEI